MTRRYVCRRGFTREYGGGGNGERQVEIGQQARPFRGQAREEAGPAVSAARRYRHPGWPGTWPGTPPVPPRSILQ
ncbi:hypothetical protein CQW32_27210 [Pseudomonas putida]|nr:hypothetical protein CQW32_27210 [Pseudomonas putida]